MIESVLNTAAVMMLPYARVILCALVIGRNVLANVDEVISIVTGGISETLKLAVELAKVILPVPVVVPLFQFKVALLNANVPFVLKLITAPFQFKIPL